MNILNRIKQLFTHRHCNNCGKKAPRHTMRKIWDYHAQPTNGWYPRLHICTQCQKPPTPTPDENTIYLDCDMYEADRHCLRGQENIPHGIRAVHAQAIAGC